VNFFLGITVLDSLLIIIKPIRRYHFAYFPNFHFIGVVLIYILTIDRIAQAKNEGMDPYMESSREWEHEKVCQALMTLRDQDQIIQARPTT